MKNKALEMTATRRLYEGVVVPAVLYGVKTWSMTADRILVVLDMRCLRGMLGVKNGQREE